MRIRFCSALAALLCLLLLAACRGAAGPAGTAEAAAPQSAPADAVPETTATPESAPPCTDAGLTLALDGCLAYEADSAGGSLKTAIAADGLVRCLACYGGSEADLTACAVRWHDGLDAEDQALLALNWPGVRGTARSITDSDEAVQGLLADAGVDGDYTGVDLPAAADGMDALDAVLAAPEQPEK